MREALIRFGFGVMLALTGVGAAYAAEQPEKEWTFMVFLNGDNNLDPYGSSDMKEMEKVGSTDRYNVIVLRDTFNQNVTSKIYHVQKGGSTVVKDFGANIDMGDWRNLVEYFRYVRENYPAKRYLVDIWNHGSGWIRKRELQGPTRGISYDDHSRNHITTPQLGEALKQMQLLNGGKKIDILGMDACLMQMAEVISEVKESVAVIVGSEDTEPADGWAYEGVLGALRDAPTMDAEEFGTAIERAYTASYTNGSQGSQAVQGSAVSTERFEAVQAALNEYISVAMSLMGRYRDTFLRAMEETQKYYTADNKDFVHFVLKAREKIDHEGFRAVSDALIAAAKGTVVANFTNAPKLANSHGFAVWMPHVAVYDSRYADYRALKWNKETRWADFLEGIYYPTTPVVSITGAAATDAGGDGFVNFGEKVRVRIELLNDSPVAAKNVTVRVNAAEGFDVPTALVEGIALPQGTKAIEGLELLAGARAGSYPVEIVVSVPEIGEIRKTIEVAVDGEVTIENYALSSPHNYPNSYDQSWTITRPGVKGLRVHFAKLITENRVDAVSLYDGKGKLIARFDGNRPAFWSPMVVGDTVRIQLKTDSSVTYYGFDIDQIAY